MVCPITGAESYVDEAVKSMKAVELAVARKGCCQNIACVLKKGCVESEVGGREHRSEEEFLGSFYSSRITLGLYRNPTQDQRLLSPVLIIMML
jgi:hypothetical protein